MITDLLGAVQFVTRVPLRLARRVDERRSLPWLPIVGVLIGAVVGLVAWTAATWISAPVAAVVAIGIQLLITGAFHEDGLADTADAFGGGWSTDERLAILKDSRHGTYGVAALAFSIVARITALASIASGAAMMAALVSAHGIGRAAAVIVAKTVDPAAEGGLGSEAGRVLSTAAVAIGGCVTLAAAAFVSGWWAIVFIGVAVTATAATVQLARRKIGGVAGDVLGAVEQVVECSVLLAAAGLATHHRLWWQ